jgi:pimeloyl-[acyl-carrier protein] methyl ester esterase
MGELTIGTGSDSGRSIYYEHHHGKRLPMLCIHGWGMNVRSWDTFFPVLQAAGHGVVTFDQRGCGRSSKDFSEVSITSSADDAVRLLDHLKIDRVVLNGWSIGGAIAVAAADKLGGRCAGVVSTVGATPRHVQAADFGYGFPPGSIDAQIPLLRRNRVAFLNGFVEATFARSVDAAWKSWMFDVLTQTAPCADLALKDLEQLDQRDILRRLEVPFLAIVGGKDQLVTPDVVRQAARLAPRGRAEEFADCGHAPFLEDPERYERLVLEFVQSLS